MLSSSSTTRMVAAIGALGWCWWPDSNGRPTDYESVALPAELHQRSGVAHYTRPAPATPRREGRHGGSPPVGGIQPPVARFCSAYRRSVAFRRQERGVSCAPRGPALPSASP